MFKKKDIKEELKSLDFRSLEESFEFVVTKTNSIIELLKCSALHIEGQSYIPIKRGTNYSVIEPYNLDSKKLLNSYKIAFAEGDITVPVKKVGYIQIPESKLVTFRSKVDEINHKKAIIKYGALKLFPKRHERRRFFQNLQEGMVTSTIYRDIPIASSLTDSISISWTNNQKAPVLLNIEDINSLMSSTDEFESSQRVNYLLEDAKSKGIKLYRNLDVKVHPTITCYRKLDCGKYERVLFNTSTPIIVARANNEQVKFTPLDKYPPLKQRKQPRRKHNSNLESYIPELGIYIRK
ncbi:MULTISPECIES: DNA replication terminus site-binding protein [Vibrio]|uniref:DNA replication terminus site-binding protein n=2 Tax=Vibrionaceae TaxID=641 RepID=UPI000841F00E|nr:MULTISPECIES: DNA replication terminus site-binding protein [Vibrio]ODM56047.1 hypothetical protein BC455_22585 [Vibrio harveyi]USD58537.1 hypothetical protein J4N44_27980 [Vibrio sp. SCSIO 43155]